MDDYVMHMTRVTLLDEHLERNPISVKKTTISRVLYAGKSIKHDTDKERMTSYHSEILQAAGARIDKLSGFLLIYPTCCLHLVEAETDILMHLLKHLHQDTRYLDSVCLLSFTENVPYRAFTAWMTAFNNSANLGPYDAHPKNSLLTAVAELNVNMLKWGKELSEMNKEQQAISLDSVRTAAELLLPDDAGVVYSIILAEDVPKLKDVLELFDEPLEDIIFDAEIVWPKPQKVFSMTPPTIYFVGPGQA